MNHIQPNIKTKMTYQERQERAKRAIMFSAFIIVFTVTTGAFIFFGYMQQRALYNAQCVTEFEENFIESRYEQNKTN
jgi:UTP:GlnB (protein PII) uridylyltransferase